MYCRSRVVLDVLTHDCTVERTNLTIGRVGFTVWSWMYPVVLDVRTHPSFMKNKTVPFS